MISSREVTGALIDDLARAVAGPMPRKRALKLMGGVLLTASLPAGLRPKLALADCPGHCDGAGEKLCSIPKGPGVCIHACCTTGQPVCCTNTGEVRCCYPGQRCKKVGEFNQCECTGEMCGNKCCPQGQFCETHWFGANECIHLCPDGRKRCGNDCCSSDQSCSGDACECSDPKKVKVGGFCRRKQDDPGDPPVKRNADKNFFDMARESNAAHGGRRLIPGSALQRASVPAGAAGALLAMAAVRGFGGVALGAFTDGHKDPRFGRKVVPKVPRIPRLRPGDNLSSGAASALQEMLTAEAKAYALVQAAATALAKGRSAVSKHQRVTARRQMRASAGFCSAAVKVLKTLSGKRSKAAQALRAGGSQEIFMSSDGFAAFQDSVRASGLPADLVALMKSFGVTKGGLNRAQAGVLVFGTQDPSPVLISALTDAEQAKATSTLIAELDRFAKRARNSPTLPGRRLGRQNPLRRRTVGRARRPG